MTNLTPEDEKFIEEQKIKSELAVFWENFAEVLPKSRARSEIGDKKLFEAFNDTFRKYRNYIITTKNEEIEKAREEEKESVNEKLKQQARKDFDEFFGGRLYLNEVEQLEDELCDFIDFLIDKVADTIREECAREVEELSTPIPSRPNLY